MKQTLLLLATMFCLDLFAQQTCQSFSSGLPADWFTKGGMKVSDYDNPLNSCKEEQGLQTPGVGGNNPATLILNKMRYSSANPNIRLSFDLFVFDANMKCKSMKDLPCETYVQLWIVKKDFTNVNKAPGSDDVYYSKEFQLKVSNGTNSFLLEGVQMTNNTEYRIVIDFKTPKNCVQGNTKYIIDNVCTTPTACDANGCPPVARTDYFAQGQNFTGNTVKGNVYGDYQLWAAQVSAEFKAKSLAIAPAEEKGTDGDEDNTPLSGVTFVLVSGPAVVSATGCGNTTPGAGSLQFNSNGTFTYTRTNTCVSAVKFTYYIQDNKGKKSNNADVFIEFAAGTTLPVKFASFSASRKSASMVELQWQTASEEGNRGFYVQRNNKGSWESVAFVFSAAPSGTSTSALSYSYKDGSNSHSAVSQYRLQQVDVDGKVKYSDIRTVKGEAKGLSVQVYPNPSLNGRVNLVFTGAAEREIAVMDAAGRTVQQQKATGSSTLIDNLNDGFYSIRITDRRSGEVVTEKLMVRRK